MKDNETPQSRPGPEFGLCTLIFRSSAPSLSGGNSLLPMLVNAGRGQATASVAGQGKGLPQPSSRCLARGSAPHTELWDHLWEEGSRAGCILLASAPSVKLGPPLSQG